MSMVTFELKQNEKLSARELEILELAKAAEIEYDEDCPALTPAMEKAFLLAAKARNRYIGKAIG